MTRICAYCKDPMSEKCGRCGGPADPVIGIPPTLSGEPAIFCCPRCDETFAKGEVFDGERWVQAKLSHGVCEKCYPVALAEIAEMKASQSKEEAP